MRNFVEMINQHIVIVEILIPKTDSVYWTAVHLNAESVHCTFKTGVVAFKRRELLADETQSLCGSLFIDEHPSRKGG